MPPVNKIDGLAAARSQTPEDIRMAADDIKINIKFDFDSLKGKEFYFVCKYWECSKLCEVLGEHFEILEKAQYYETDSKGPDPDQKFYLDITSKDSIFRRDIYTKRRYHGSITITISRAEDDDSWVFKVIDLDDEHHRISRMQREKKSENPDWEPGCYDPFKLFQAIVWKFAFSE